MRVSSAGMAWMLAFFTTATAAGGAEAQSPDLGLPSIDVHWTPAPVPQGTVFEVVVTGAPGPVEGEFAGEPLHFEPRDADTTEGERHVALAATPVGEEGSLPLRIEIRRADGGVQALAPTVEVVPGDYRMEELTVAPEFGRPQPPEIQRRIDSESARAMQVSRNSHHTPRMWEAPFVAPRESRVTSGFGHGRVFNGQVQSRHTGTDYAGAVGTPVFAPARGVVALVDAFYLGGNVIYLDHGAGLVTAYLHLSAHEVEEGDLVEPGQIIGRIGATGRVTGPHLHWIVRYGVLSVDGRSLLELD